MRNMYFERFRVVTDCQEPRKRISFQSNPLPPFLYCKLWAASSTQASVRACTVAFPSKLKDAGPCLLLLLLLHVLITSLL